MKHNFKIGEKVIIYKNFDIFKSFGWISDMNHTLNKIGIIDSFYDNEFLTIRIIVSIKDDEKWLYPYFCLKNYRLEKLNKILENES